METGTRIYYTGDMANDEGFGTITAMTSDRWGHHVAIQMDDDREIKVDRIAFSDVYLGHGGTRFVTLEAYNNFTRENYRKFVGSLKGWNDSK